MIFDDAIIIVTFEKTYQSYVFLFHRRDKYLKRLQINSISIRILLKPMPLTSCIISRFTKHEICVYRMQRGNLAAILK